MVDLHNSEEQASASKEILYLVDLLQRQKKIVDLALKEKDLAIEENMKLVLELTKIKVNNI